MFERFTHGARQVVVLAQHEARQLRHDYIGTEHLLLGLLAEGEGRAAGVLRAAGVDADGIRADLQRIVGTQLRQDADAAVLRSIGIDLEAVRAAVEASFGPGVLDHAQRCRRWGRGRRGRGRRGRRGGLVCVHSPFTLRAKKVLELSLREALRLKHDYIGTEHVLLGLLREGQGLAAHVLTLHGLSLDDLRRRVLASLGKAA